MESKFKIQGVVTEIGDVYQVRRVMKPDIFKLILSIKTEDNQVLYPEIRNGGLKILEKEGVEVGSMVEIEFTFQGSEKDGKKYNNILIQSIKRL